MSNKHIFDRVKLRGERDRGQVSLYFNKELFKAFQVYCDKENVSASEILEEFMRDTLSEADKPQNPNDNLADAIKHLSQSAKSGEVRKHLEKAAIVARDTAKKK